MLTGWYGMGSAIEAYLETGAPGARLAPRAAGAAAREAREWPAFRTLLSNMEMVLAKSDLAIAARYASWCPSGRCASASSAPSAPSTATLAMLSC